MAKAKDEKEGIVPRLRFPEFRKAAGWEMCKIDSLLTESRIHSSINDTSKRITVRLHLQGVERRDVRGTESTDATVHYWRSAGQFIYGKQNIHKGAFGLIPSDLDGFESSQDIPTFDFNQSANPLWFIQLLSRESCYKSFENLMKGTGSKRLNERVFQSVEIPKPSLAEQKKIADCLTSLDEVIVAQRQKVEALKAHKKGLMQQLFPREGETLPRLRFPEFEGQAEWEEKTLEKMTDKVGSGITPTGGDKNYKTSGRPFVRSQNVGWGQLLLDDIAFIDEPTHQSFVATEIIESDVLLNITGASIGRSAVADSRIVGGNVNQHVCIIRVEVDKLNPVLLNQFLISVRGQKQIDSFQAGGNRQGLNFAQIRSFEIPLPPSLAEQKRIADCLSSLDARIVAESEKLDVLKTHKKGLMQQLFPTSEEA